MPNTAAALLLVREVDRPNFGVTLDYGHQLMAGENPAQSVAMAGAAGKLFGVQASGRVRLQEGRKEAVARAGWRRAARRARCRAGCTAEENLMHALVVSPSVGLPASPCS